MFQFSCTFALEISLKLGATPAMHYLRYPVSKTKI